MNRPTAIVAGVLLLGGLLGLLGLLGLGPWGGTDALAQKSNAKGQAAPARMQAQPDLKVPQGVLARLLERSEAVVARTARGQRLEDAPPFEVTERIDSLEMHPCSDCHGDQETNRKVRELADEHTELGFQHGAGRFWCYDACHNAGDMDNLRNARGEAVSFDQSYKICGQCHFNQEKDWTFGAHGKRAGSFEVPREVPVSHEDFDWSDREKIAKWNDERVRHNCTDCHNAHSPAIRPYEPSPPPLPRAGLVLHGKERHTRPPIWDELAHRQANARGDNAAGKAGAHDTAPSAGQGGNKQ